MLVRQEQEDEQELEQAKREVAPRTAVMLTHISCFRVTVPCTPCDCFR